MYTLLFLEMCQCSQIFPVMDIVQLISLFLLCQVYTQIRLGLFAHIFIDLFTYTQACTYVDSDTVCIIVPLCATTMDLKSNNQDMLQV